MSDKLTDLEQTILTGLECKRDMFLLRLKDVLTEEALLHARIANEFNDLLEKHLKGE